MNDRSGHVRHILICTTTVWTTQLYAVQFSRGSMSPQKFPTIRYVVYMFPSPPPPLHTHTHKHAHSHALMWTEIFRGSTYILVVSRHGVDRKHSENFTSANIHVILWYIPKQQHHFSAIKTQTSLARPPCLNFGPKLAAALLVLSFLACSAAW